MVHAKVVVIIPVYNEERHIGSLCLALKAQTYPDFDVLIVDNGSTDKTVYIASQYYRVITCTAPGSYVAWNYGVKQSESKYLAFTNADCIPCSRWLEELVGGLEEGYDAVAGTTVSIPFNDGWLCKTVIDFYGNTMRTIIKLRPEMPSCYFPLFSVAYTRACFEELGPFPNLTGGDIRFSNAVIRAGKRCTIKPLAVVDHYAVDSYWEICRKFFQYGAQEKLKWYNFLGGGLRLVSAPLLYLIGVAMQLYTAGWRTPAQWNSIFLLPALETLKVVVNTLGTMWYTLVPKRRIR